MRKTLNVVLAVVLALTMIGGMAYVVTPERTSEYQISLVSAKAVTVQDATQGIRSYSDLVDTTKGFQVNEVINVAITAEVKNLEKPASNNKYKSISGKDIKVVVGSPNIDFNVARLNSPTLLTHVWSGYTGQNVATVGYAMNAGEVLKYDKAANEISWTFRGRDMYAMNASTSVGYNLVTFDPQIDDGKIVIPAIKLLDRKSEWTLGTWKYNATHEAPEAIAYTMVLTGVTLDNAGAATGEFYAKIQVSGAEKFQDEATYYVDYNGNVYDDAPTFAQIGSLRADRTAPLEWLDYVEIDVDKLEIAGGYNVYRYDVPASAVMADIPIIYGGSYDKMNGNDKNNESWVDGSLLATVQPQYWDYATNKDVVTDVNVAGGVKGMKAYDYYQDGSKTTFTAWTKTSDYPVTSVVYSANKAYYAPGYYGGYMTGSKDTTGGPYYSSKALKGTPGYGTGANTEKITVVDYFYLDVPNTVAYNANYKSTIQVWKADQLSLSNALQSDLNAIGTAPVADLSNATTFMNQIVGNFVNGNGLHPASFAGEYQATINTIPYGPYQVPQGTTVGNTTYTDRLSEKEEYESEWVTSNGSSRIIVRPLDVTVNHTYPVEQSPTGNQWVVFYHDLANVDKLAVPFQAIANLSHSSQKNPQGSAFLAPQPKDLLPALATTQYGQTQTGVAAPMILDTEGLTGGNLFGTAGSTANNNYDAALTAFGGGAIPTYTQTVAELDFVKNYAANNMMSWPVFTEVHKEIEVPVGSGAKPVLTVGELHDASATSSSTSALFPLDYKSQITAIRFYDTLADSTVEKDSAMVAFVEDWVPANGDPLTKAPANFAYGTYGSVIFTSVEVRVVDGKSYIDLGDAYICDALGVYTKVANTNQLYLAQLVVVTMAKNNITVDLSFNAKYAAPVTIWDIEEVAEANRDIVYHNGIVVYTICANSNDRPWISMVTENVQFASDDGYGIALFDGYNHDPNNATWASTDWAVTGAGRRIYRSNDSNLSYSDDSKINNGHVNESASMIAAQKYFGLDTSYGTTFLVKDGTFENKGAAAVYSENVTGTFKYGDLVIIGESVEEPTEEEPIEEPADDEPIDDEPIDDEPVDDEPVDDEPVDEAPVAPRTGDASANVAIALAAAAIVAAAGLAFVMKKVR